MKKIQFLIKLSKEGRFQIIEPSDEVSEAYLQKADSHLESAKILLDSEKFEECVSMAYYGMYHALLAALFKCGIKSENHSASILVLKELFNEEDLAAEISFGKKERIDKQYYTDFKLTKLDCEDMIKRAENFIIRIKIIINQLNEEKILQIRDKLNTVLDLNQKK